MVFFDIWSIIYDTKESNMDCVSIYKFPAYLILPFIVLPIVNLWFLSNSAKILFSFFLHHKECNFEIFFSRLMRLTAFSHSILVVLRQPDDDILYIYVCLSTQYACNWQQLIDNHVNP